MMRMDSSEPTPLLPRPELGLALAGGAARGFFHLGVVEALAEAGIRPTWFSGTSAGAIVAACCAGGLAPHEIRGIASRVSWHKSVLGLRQSAWDMFSAARAYVMRSPERLPAGFLENSRIARTIDAALGGRKFSDLAPLILTACDMRSGEEVLFCSPAVARHLTARGYPVAAAADAPEWERLYGHRAVLAPFEDVGTAVRCSSCIPGVMTTVHVECPDGNGCAQKRLLNDGGVVDLVPVKPLKAAGCKRVIAVFLGLLPRSTDAGHFAAVGANSVNYLARDQLAGSLREADYVLYDPGIEDVSLVKLDMKLADRGYHFTKERLPEIRRALGLELVADKNAPAPLLAGASGL
jgi:NTE family protein